MAEHITIGDVAPRVQYVASGAQTGFVFPFPVFKAADLEVFAGALRKTDGFTVSGAGESAGGTVTFTTPPASGTLITLRRRLRLQRVSDFQENGELRARVLNDELDYQTAGLQQLADELRRTLRLDPTDTGPDPVLPAREARANRLLAFDSVGGITVIPATGTGGGGAAAIVQPMVGAIERSVADKLNETLSVRDFGAAGDGVSDDSAAIQAAFDAAALTQRHILIPEGDHVITRGLVLPGAAAGLTMHGRLMYRGAGREAALTLGDGGQTRNGEKLYWGLRVMRAVQADWLDERDIGIVLRNLDVSTVHILEARGFTIGVRTLGDGRGFEDTSIFLNRLVDNRIGLDIRCGTAAGWNASVRYHGGHFAVSSATWPLLDRFGVRLSTEPGAYRAHNRHVFDAPNFELRQAGANVAIPFLVEVDSRSVIARDMRMEGCSAIVARHMGSAQDHQYDVAWASQAYLLDVEYGTLAPRAGAVLTTRHLSAAHTALHRPVLLVENLRAAAFRWAQGQVGFDRLASISTNVTGTPTNLADFVQPGLDGFTLTGGGVRLGPARGIGAVVDTRGCRDFAVSVDADQPRLFVQCFDASWNLLTDGSGQLVRGSGLSFTWAATQRWWQGTADLSDATLNRLQAVRLDPAVGFAIIGICRVDRDYEARAFRLFCDPRFSPPVLYGLPGMPHGSRELQAEVPDWDPLSLAPNETRQTNVAVPGAAAGDFVHVAFSQPTTGVVFLGAIGAAGLVTAIAWNRASAPIDLAGGTLRVRVTKA